MHNKQMKIVFFIAAFGWFFSIAVQAANVLIPAIADSAKPTSDFNTKIWSQAAVFDEFVTTKGDIASVKTKVRLLHDQDNLYVGFECLDQDPKQVTTNTRYPPEGDAVALLLDSFNDGLASYVFIGNYKGDTLNAVLADGSENLRFSFKTNFSASGKLTANGYNVVITIPFKSFPYNWQPSTIMSFRAIRFIPNNKEIDSYPYIAEDRMGDVSFQYQKITFKNIAKSEFTKPWFDANSIYQNRQRFAVGYDLSTLAGRALGWGIIDSSTADYKIFPSHTLAASKHPKPLPIDLKTQWVENQLNNIDFYPHKKIGNLDHFLNRTQTTSFIVVHNDKIIYEKYFNGANQSSITPAFSMTKSFLSTLIGIAVNKHQIQAIDDPITKYLPELLKRDQRFARVKIQDLLSMATGINIDKGKDILHSDDTKAYWSPDLKNVILNTLSIREAPERHWNYHDYFPQLAGLALIRATHQSATQLLQNELWDTLGMQYGASWSIDSEKDDLEQLAIGINAVPLDYAKFGLLFLHDGKWNNKQIIPASWVKEATQPSLKPHELGYYPADWLDLGYYKYYWWGLKRPSNNNDKNDFFAFGHGGQFIYVSPQKNLVIVRTGMEPGIRGTAWMKLLYNFASKF